MAKDRILVCDDEPELRETIREYLERRGYEVVLAGDGAELDLRLAEGRIDAVILDITMPGEDGLSILRRLRASHRVGVVMLTAAGDVIDRIVGLEMGADDYLAKPVSFRELEARLRAVLRRLAEGRAVPVDAAPDPLAPLRFAGFVLDRARARLTAPSGEEVPLTPLEFRMLRAFAEHPGRVLNRDQLLELAHDRGWDPLDRSIDIRISRLRQKIETNPKKPVLIRTVRGLGYLFDPHGGAG
jgi:two-component system phosphate regulon response regulator OmpR